MSPIDLSTRIARARGAVSRYRALALVTGTFLLVLCVELVLKYVLKAPDSFMRYVRWIPFAHGWIYVVYLVTVVDLWTKMRWRFGRLVTMVLAGVVPVMSFVVEKKVHAEATALLDGAERAAQGGGAGAPSTGDDAATV
ncbi:integral membrane protein [Flavimobilis soli]|uniref:Integral membrane protein n=1 Tax=Flavimobilis soli TaxID=442709 RepID=A0A2A9EBU8_9MICO|nr:DUF3817 domain-containing protein [Flavimobilis soli]PFG36273.1 integral membrane protein [Flavimobilis soli]